KRDDNRLHTRRLVLRDIKDPVVVKKLFDTLGTRFATRPGGYTRILRLGPRRGDGAEMAILQLLGSEYKPESKKEDEKGKKKGEKAEPAADKAEAAPKAKAKAEKADKTPKSAKGEKKEAKPKGGRKPKAEKESAE